MPNNLTVTQGIKGGFHLTVTIHASWLFKIQLMQQLIGFDTIMSHHPNQHSNSFFHIQFSDSTLMVTMYTTHRIANYIKSTSYCELTITIISPKTHINTYSRPWRMDSFHLSKEPSKPTQIPISIAINQLIEFQIFCNIKREIYLT